MKQPKKLTREQKEAVAAYDLKTEQWMFLESISECYIKIIQKETNKIKIIDKYVRKVHKK